MMVSSIYERHKIPTPASVSSAASLTEVRRTYGDEGTIERTNDDRIVFTNGGSICDLPGESGLEVTYPDGRTTELPGRIVPNVKSGRLEIQMPVQDPTTGKTDTWTQQLNSNGSVSFERAASSAQDWITASVTPSGAVTAWATMPSGEDFMPKVSLEQGKLVFADDNLPSMEVSPAVPMEWLLSA